MDNKDKGFVIVEQPITYKLNVEKIKTLDDVKIVLDGLDIKITLQEGITNKTYEKLKKYL